MCPMYTSLEERVNKNDLVCMCGAVAQGLEYWTVDRRIRADWSAAVLKLGQFRSPYVACVFGQNTTSRSSFPYGVHAREVKQNHGGRE